MRFISTRGRAPQTSLAEALRRGLAPDGGLYVPATLPPLPPSFFAALPDAPLAATATALFEHLVGADLDGHELKTAIHQALDFPIPLVQLSDRLRVLELFHGPTLAFKDVAARVMARLFALLLGEERSLMVLVATSGDTGGAVAQAFHGVAGTRVAVLYPEGRVTPLQERQFTTLGSNVRAFAVAGSFDDCQHLVKQAFADQALVDQLHLTSANSINIGRLLPQIAYYFHLASRLSRADRERPRIIATPSGNFGNLTAGLLAKRLGLACRYFLAATNVNDTVPAYLESGRFAPQPSRQTLSSAMDVGDPSNFARIRHLYADDLDALRRDLRGSRHDDDATRRTIQEIERRYGYVLDPHTAVGVAALGGALENEPAETIGIVLATAHPIKFREVVEPLIGRPIPAPPQVTALAERTMARQSIAVDYNQLRAQLLAWER